MGSGCSACGSDRCVHNTAAILDFPGQSAVSCGDLKRAGYDGIISSVECVFLPDLIVVCECGVGGSDIGGGGDLPS